MIGVGKIKQYTNVLDKPLSKGKQEVSLSAFAFLFSELVQYNQTQVDNIAELERRLEDAGYAVGARVLELLCHREKGNRRETRLLGILSFVHSTVWKVLFGKALEIGFGGTLVKKVLMEVSDRFQDMKDGLLPDAWDLGEPTMVDLWSCLVLRSAVQGSRIESLAALQQMNLFPLEQIKPNCSPVADSLEKGTEHEDEYMISEKELLVNRFISILKDMGTFNCGAFVAGIVRGVLDSAGFPAVVTAHFVPVEGQLRPRTTILIKFAEEVDTASFMSDMSLGLNALLHLNLHAKGTTERSKIRMMFTQVSCSLSLVSMFELVPSDLVSISSETNASLFIYRNASDVAYILVCVDDIVNTGNHNSYDIEHISQSAYHVVGCLIKDVGQLHDFLGVGVN
ncbi:hypothetical protein RJ639_013138 [Escallonia herrerae]|uniref:Trafficking protein particle complex subunit 5 n=1 Tax=Escallonia herrerae TaxID=1293975 RepID=A0AA88VKV2_9ASTE|nr:hypothetical protein RJ639_013138 [Escallonia herrerae]